MQILDGFAYHSYYLRKGASPLLEAPRHALVKGVDAQMQKLHSLEFHRSVGVWSLCKNVENAARTAFHCLAICGSFLLLSIAYPLGAFGSALRPELQEAKTLEKIRTALQQNDLTEDRLKSERLDFEDCCKATLSSPQESYVEGWRFDELKEQFTEVESLIQEKALQKMKTSFEEIHEALDENSTITISEYFAKRDVFWEREEQFKADNLINSDPDLQTLAENINNLILKWDLALHAYAKALQPANSQPQERMDRDSSLLFNPHAPDDEQYFKDFLNAYGNTSLQTCKPRELKPIEQIEPGNNTSRLTRLTNKIEEAIGNAIFRTLSYLLLSEEPYY